MSKFCGPDPSPGSGLSIEAISLNLAENGFVVAPQFFPLHLCRLLRQEVEEIWAAGEVTTAAVGRGEQKQRRTEIRTDCIHWLEEPTLTPAQQQYWERMQDLRLQVNRELFLGAFEYEAHLARFAPGGFYKPHLDQHQDTRARIVSAITYLDEDWAEADGGALRLYTDSQLGTEGPFLDIYPDAGQLVLFLSAEFWHEVRLAHRARTTLTGWFRQREEAVPAIFA